MDEEEDTVVNVLPKQTLKCLIFTRILPLIRADDSTRLIIGVVILSFIGAADDRVHARVDYTVVYVGAVARLLGGADDVRVVLSNNFRSQLSFLLRLRNIFQRMLDQI